MIKKELEPSLRLKKLHVLQRRLSKNHPKFQEIESELGKRMAGYKGEKSLQYYLSFLDEKRYHIFHGLRIKDPANGQFFEMDVLVISPTHFLILESKNLRGELHFDHIFDQLIQTNENKKISYTSPLAQINRQQFQLKRLLMHNNYPIPPLQTLLVITNSSAILSTTQGHPHIQKITHSVNLLQKFNKYERQFKNGDLTGKQIQKLTNQLLKMNTPFDEDILMKFGINEDDLLKGVFCPICNTLPMKRTQRKWDCTDCGYSSRTAHIDSLTDYILLFGTTITNRKLRDFLLLPSCSAAQRILNSVSIDFDGNTKGRVYYLSKNPSYNHI
ncbi:nuclease-related domain-containing protein [Fredinandcohnia quinoae]|uniref:NERD domain-containing protein n=1 Tax=Fredinandcohnia quinoae TaxID=2918902 RepID=A0AAW5E4R1_9BACI|nr:nuclease-related domain-containing protein [Fredinandcohnia sp. SECRCQ15]MCH1625804.1 NERD domain-containing protein [Fredinandcohnia sp. SECRCQ15]